MWVVLAYKLGKTGRDNFGFKEELGLSALFAFCAVVTWYELNMSNILVAVGYLFAHKRRMFRILRKSHKVSLDC